MGHFKKAAFSVGSKKTFISQKAASYILLSQITSTSSHKGSLVFNTLKTQQVEITALVASHILYQQSIESLLYESLVFGWGSHSL